MVAENAIGQSVESPIETVSACVKPSGIPTPMRGVVTSNSVEVYWSEPSDDGGCPLASYSVLRDDAGVTGTFTEVHST